jgi:DNA-binding response OmpR family regulator
MSVILLLDDDLGFVFWLGQALAEADLKPMPAQSVAAAERLLRVFKVKVDLLIVNPAISGGAEFARTLRRRQRRLPVVAALGHPDDLEPVVRDADTARSKPMVLDGAAREEWLLLVEGLLSGRGGGPSRKAAARDQG